MTILEFFGILNLMAHSSYKLFESITVDRGYSLASGFFILSLNNGVEYTYFTIRGLLDKRPVRIYPNARFDRWG